MSNIRSLEKALGNTNKVIQKSEFACYQKLGKSLVFSKDLPKNHKLNPEDLKVKVAEPKGIDGKDFDKVIGRILTRDVNENQSVHVKDLI